MRKIKVYKIKNDAQQIFGICGFITNKAWSREFISQFGTVYANSTRDLTARNYTTWFPLRHFSEWELLDLLRDNHLVLKLKKDCFLGKKGEDILLKV